MNGISMQKEQTRRQTQGCEGIRPTGKVTAKKIRQLIEFQEYKCAMTGVELTPETASLDHITPVASGGLNDMENIQVVTRTVNQAKGQLSEQEFVKMCVLVAIKSKRLLDDLDI